MGNGDVVLFQSGGGGNKKTPSLNMVKLYQHCRKTTNKHLGKFINGHVSVG